MKVEIPKRDTPRWPTVFGVGALMFGLGLGVAAWGTSEDVSAASEGARGGDGVDASEGEVGSEGESEAAAESESEAESEAEAAAESEAEGESEGESEAAAEAETEAETEAEAEAESEAETETEAESESESEVESESEAASVAAAASTVRPVVAAPGSLSVRRGRVAYLRCDRASGQNCARDEVVEAAVWTAFEGLLACGNAPRAPGQADIRLDYRGDAAPLVEWRDTFGDDVVRLNREAVLGCLRESLSSTRVSIGAERLLLSFRFRVE